MTFRTTFVAAAAAAAAVAVAAGDVFWQDCCLEGSDGTASKWLNDEANKANGYLYNWGLLTRVADFESSNTCDNPPCFRASAFMHADSEPPNSMYPSTRNVMCDNMISEGKGTSICQNSEWAAALSPGMCDEDQSPWHYATLGAGFYRDSGEQDSTYAEGKVYCSGYYPSDANTVDKRNPSNGLGLHANGIPVGDWTPDQDHACVGDKCITGFDTTGDLVGKCNYDDVAPEGGYRAKQCINPKCKQ